MKETTEVTLIDNEIIKIDKLIALSTAQVFVRVSKNLVAGIETNNARRNCGRVLFFRNLGTAYEYVGFVLTREEKERCVLFDICVSQPTRSEMFVQKAFQIQKEETDFLQQKEKSGSLNNQMRILARPHCA